MAKATRIKARSRSNSNGRRRSAGRPSQGAEKVGREALVAKACELLRRHPPKEVTGASLARYAAVDPALVRYYFRDRSSLLVAATEQFTGVFDAALAEALAKSDGSPEQRIRSRLKALLVLRRACPFFHRLMFEEVLMSGSPAAKRLLRRLTERGAGAYREALEEGAKRGTLREVNAPLLFIAIIGLAAILGSAVPMMQIADNRKANEDELDRQYLEFVYDLLMNGIRTRSTAKAAASERSNRRKLRLARLILLGRRTGAGAGRADLA